MSTDRWIRASDQERDKVVDVLRDAYAAGRLSREELDERCAAAYSAMTQGELLDLIADLPAPPPSGLPSDIVARPDAARNVTRRACVRVTLMCLLVLVAGLAGRVLPGAVWVVVLVSIVLVLPLARGTARRRSGRSDRW